MSNNADAQCNYCKKPRLNDRLTSGKDAITKSDMWACPMHVSFLKKVNKSKTAEHMDNYGLFRGA